MLWWFLPPQSDFVKYLPLSESKKRTLSSCWSGFRKLPSQRGAWSCCVWLCPGNHSGGKTPSLRAWFVLEEADWQGMGKLSESTLLLPALFWKKSLCFGNEEQPIFGNKNISKRISNFRNDNLRNQTVSPDDWGRPDSPPRLWSVSACG